MFLVALISRYKRSTHERRKREPSLKKNNKENETKKKNKRELRVAVKDFIVEKEEEIVKT